MTFQDPFHDLGRWYLNKGPDVLIIRQDITLIQFVKDIGSQTIVQVEVPPYSHVYIPHGFVECFGKTSGDCKTEIFYSHKDLNKALKKIRKLQ